MVDYEEMWFKFKKYIITKNSHGKNELINKMTDLEVEQINKEEEKAIEESKEEILEKEASIDLNCDADLD